MSAPRPAERRNEKRIQLSEPIVARFGSSVVVIIDLSASGARIEHYSRIDRDTERPLRLQWGQESVGIRSRLIRSRVDRVLPGDAGITVYRSGVMFDASQEAEIAHVRELIANAIAATLVEQVANARGFWTEAKEDMPIFRQGILTTSDPELDAKLRNFLPDPSLVQQRGFIRMKLLGNAWSRRWTLDPSQPEDGFTISAEEPETEIRLLCEVFRTSPEEGRQLIRKLAAASIERKR
jgi:hypothetical protein